MMLKPVFYFSFHDCLEPYPPLCGVRDTVRPGIDGCLKWTCEVTTQTEDLDIDPRIYINDAYSFPYAWVIGGLLLAAMVAILGFCCWCCRRRQNRPNFRLPVWTRTQAGAQRSDLRELVRAFQTEDASQERAAQERAARAAQAIADQQRAALVHSQGRAAANRAAQAIAVQERAERVHSQARAAANRAAQVLAVHERAAQVRAEAEAAERTLREAEELAAEEERAAAQVI